MVKLNTTQPHKFNHAHDLSDLLANVNEEIKSHLIKIMSTCLSKPITPFEGCNINLVSHLIFVSV